MLAIKVYVRYAWRGAIAQFAADNYQSLIPSMSFWKMSGMGRRTAKKDVDVKFRAPEDFIERFDEVTRKVGHATRGEAIRSAMQRYLNALQESSTTHTERVDE
jgi:hypothetical protein